MNLEQESIEQRWRLLGYPYRVTYFGELSRLRHEHGLDPRIYFKAEMNALREAMMHGGTVIDTRTGQLLHPLKVAQTTQESTIETRDAVSPQDACVR